PACASGRSCVVMATCWRLRISSAICARTSLLVVVVVVIGFRCALGLFLVQVAQDLLDAVLVTDRFVESELDLGHAAQAQPCTDLPAEKRRRALQRLLGFAARLGVAE